MSIQSGQARKHEEETQQASPLGATPIRRVRKDAANQIRDIPKNELTPKIQSVMSSLVNEIDQLRDELTNANKRILLLENIADKDPLVPALNRRGFMRELEKSISYANRYDSRICLLYIDVDGFKPINDTYGHKAGDAALHHITSFLTRSVRQTDIVARVGGDEFAIILQQADLKSARSKALLLESGIMETPCIHEDVTMSLKITVGAASLKKGDDCAKLIARADEEMYRVRKKRRSSRD